MAATDLLDMPTGRYWALLGLCLLCGNPSAQTETEEESGEEIDPVSLEFLEFLGEWETANGEWLDPTELDSESDDTPAPEDGDE